MLAGVTFAFTASESCAFARAPASRGAVSAACSRSGQVVGASSGTTSTSAVQTAYTSLAILIPVQVPDSGSGAIPTASGTASAPTSTSTKNGASKGGIDWAVAGPAGLLILIAGLM